MRKAPLKIPIKLPPIVPPIVPLKAIVPLIVKPIPPEVMTPYFEEFTALAQFGLGCLLVSPAPVFAGPYYRVLVAIVKEYAPSLPAQPAWGWTMICTGLLLGFALMRQRKVIRGTTLIVSAMIWASFALTFAFSGKVLTGTVVYGLMWAFCLRSFVRLWGNRVGKAKGAGKKGDKGDKDDKRDTGDTGNVGKSGGAWNHEGRSVEE